MQNPATLPFLLRSRALADPNRRAFTFLSSEAGKETHFTYGELDHRARAIAVRLRRIRPSENPEPVLVVFPPGLDFLQNFLGCLYACLIAVPTRCPHPRRPCTHLENIAADCGAVFGLTTRELAPALTARLPNIQWLAATEIAEPPGGDYSQLEASPAQTAYLQYTSGSTAAPKGVMIRHSNLMANCDEITNRWQISPESRILSWLPHFHDMGLVFGLMEPIFAGCPAIVMPPMAFVQRPLSWLEAITRYKVTHSAAPNFAYESCSRISEEELGALDLNSWRVAANGAESVRPDTIARFTRYYEPFGFSPEALCPGYGLAENTLIATSSKPGLQPVVRNFSADALLRRSLEMSTEEGTRLASSGSTDVATRILIVDPGNSIPCPSGEVGEIWLSGPSVASGYWRRAEESAARFAACLADGQGPFLRTGDFGAMHEGELYVLGRIDDMMIIRGANYIPDDLELTIGRSDPALHPDGGAVFTVEVQGEPRIVVVHEVERHALRDADSQRLIRAILRAVSEDYDLDVSAVVLLRPRSLPRTHSGKKQRKEARRRFLSADLKDIHTWIAPKLRQAFRDLRSGGRAEAEAVELMPEKESMMQPDMSREKANKVIEWLRDWAGERLNSRLMDERRSIPPYVVLDLGNHGVLGLQAPERYGGLDLDHRGLIRVLQQVAGIDLTLASFIAVNNALGIRPILLHATQQKRDELLPILAPGRELAAFAATEPGAGSNVRAIAACARPDGPGAWRLWGTKIWSGTAAWAGVINTFVQFEETGSGFPGITGFILRQPSPGLRMGPEALTMGLRAMVQNEVRLEGVRVSAGDMLGEPGKGMAVAMDTMEFGRFCLAAISVGVIKRCLQLMVRHGSRRFISTGKLLENPASLARISDLSAAATAIEALVDLVAERLDHKLPVPGEVYCACKTAGPEFAWRAADHLMQQFAGRGYIETNIAPQIFRDTRILRIFEGPTEPMNMHIGSRLVHAPEELRGFIGTELGQPEIAMRLEAAAARILERCLSRSSPLSEPSAARTWAYILAGEVGSYAILLTAIQHRVQIAPGAQLQRACQWARLRFEQHLAKALGATPAEAVLLNASQVEELVAGYADAIGDIQQTLAGEQHEMDTLVRRDAEEKPSVVYSPEPAREVPQASESDRAQAIHKWLVGWLSQALGAHADSVRFTEYGVDSVTAMKLTSALAEWLGIELPSTLVWDYPTLPEMVSYLTQAVAARDSAGHAVDQQQNLDELKLLSQLDHLSEREMQVLLDQLAEVGKQS